MAESEAPLRPSSAAKHVIAAKASSLASRIRTTCARWAHLCDADNAAPPRLTAEAPRDRIRIKRENSPHTVSVTCDHAKDLLQLCADMLPKIWEHDC
jgi:hypothetical protein